MADANPRVTNPPATLEQLEQDAASRARAAIGGAAPRREVRSGEASHRQAAEGVWSSNATRMNQRAVRAARFQPPEEVVFEFNPAASPQIPNSNIPLTIGLLFSIIASFIVFFASLAGVNGGEDPIMPAFWRALGALAVLTTLSFAASWFMPEPQDRRKLLDRLEAEDRALGSGRFGEQAKVAARGERAFTMETDEEEDPRPLPDDDSGFIDKGTSVDLTANDDFTADDDFDDEDYDVPGELEGLRTEDEDDFFSEGREDFAATSPSLAGSVPEPVGRVGE
jgi:hypothetical protein